MSHVGHGLWASMATKCRPSPAFGLFWESDWEESEHKDSSSPLVFSRMLLTSYTKYVIWSWPRTGYEKEEPSGREKTNRMLSHLRDDTKQ